MSGAPRSLRTGIKAPCFPGEQNETWTFDEQAQAWYFHRFYGFQPDLNWANPAVREEMAKVMSFWLQVGAAGFRIDAAPFVLEQVSPGVDPGPKDFSIMDSWRQETQWLRGDSVLLCEANVPPSDVSTFVGSRSDGPSDRAQMMFDFLLNPRVWLALARSDAEPLIEALTTAVRLPEGGQWVSFLRNHDELDLSRLTGRDGPVAMRVGAAVPIGAAAAVAAGALVGWQFAPAAGWIAAAAVYLVWTWVVVSRMDEQRWPFGRTHHGRQSRGPPCRPPAPTGLPADRDPWAARSAVP